MNVTDALQAEVNRLRGQLAPHDPDNATPRDHFQYEVVTLVCASLHRILADLEREDSPESVPADATLQDQPPEPRDVLHFVLRGHAGSMEMANASVNLAVTRQPDVYPVVLDFHVSPIPGGDVLLRIPLTHSQAAELGRAIQDGAR